MKVWKKQKKAFLDFYDITNQKARDYIDYVFDIYDRNYGWPSSFIFDLDFEEKAKHQGVKLFNPKIYKSSFTDNRYIIAFNGDEYYIWDDTDEYFNYVFSEELLNFIEKE